MNEVKGNLLTLERGILVFGCNCQGAMNSGFGKFVHNRWPMVQAAYEGIHETAGLRLGDIVVTAGEGLKAALARHAHCLTHTLHDELVVVNAMTEFECGTDPDMVYVDYDALEAAFSRVRLLARDTGLPVHFPLIGCGLAHGKWEEVAQRIERALGPSIEKTLWTLPA